MRKITLASHLVLLASMVALSGCADMQAHMQSRLPPALPAYAGKQIEVTQARSVHVVNFADGSARISGDEGAYAVAFVDEAMRSSGGSVLVEKASAQASRLQRQRIAAVSDMLVKKGYHVAPFAPAEANVGGVQVAVDALVAVAPNCPNWEFHKYAEFGSQLPPNQGCADRTNLAAMVANPRDLVSGQVPAQAAGHGILGGEQRYRTGTITQLEDAGSATADGGSGN